MRNLRRRSVVRLSRRPSRIPRLETLEDRTLLNHGIGHHVIAQFDGVLSSPTDTRQIDINLVASDFTIQAGQTVFLGFLVKAVGGSTLDPAAVQVRTSGGAPVNPDVRTPDLAGRAQSLVIADVRLGGYRLTVAGERGTAGAFQLDVFLAGDADGNRAANFADRDLIHSLLGVTAGQSNYRPEADVDLDGRIDGYDNSLWARNHQNSTRVNPLTLTVGLGPRSLRLADGSLLTNVPASQVLGATAPRAQVSLERNSVPLGTAAADAGGNYSIPIGLTEGSNPVVVRAADTFGQRRSATAVLKLDTRPPTATSGLTGTVNTTVSFFDVFYSEPMDASAFRASNYALTVEGGPAHGQAVIISSVTEVNPSTARLTLAAALPDQGFKLVISSAVGDQADNRLAEPRTFLFTVADAVGIKEISPANGEEMVGLAREVIVRFDDRVDPLTVHATSLKVIANGQPLPGTIRVSATEMFATFFPTSALPTSTGVRIVVEGVRGRDGLLVDGDGDTVPGGKATADFRTLPLARIAGTHLFGYVYDSFNRLPGGADRPVAGATVRVDAFPGANVVTDANGYFELRDMPAPEFFVHIDGTTATSAPPGFGYPSVGKPFHSVPGQRVQLNKMGMPFHIYLPPMSMGDVLPLSPTQPTDVGFGAAGRAQLQALFPTVNPAVWDRMRVTYPPNSAVTNQGVPATQGIVIPVAPNRIPAPLPANLNPQLVVSIQAMDAQGGEVTNFDVPAPVTFPNLEGLPPGEKSLIFSFNHDAGRWDVIGAGTVSGDGLTVVSDPGVGVRAPGWHFVFSGSRNFELTDDNNGDKDYLTPDGVVWIALHPQEFLGYTAISTGLLGAAVAGNLLPVANLLPPSLQLCGANPRYFTQHLIRFFTLGGGRVTYPISSEISDFVKDQVGQHQSNRTNLFRKIREALDANINSGNRRIDLSQSIISTTTTTETGFQYTNSDIKNITLGNAPWGEDLVCAFNNTQGVRVDGFADVVDGRYVGEVTIRYSDTFGFNRGEFLFHFLQEIGLGRPFTTEIVVRESFNLTPGVPIPPLRTSTSTQASSPPLSIAEGFGNNTNVYYRFDLDNGVSISGQTDSNGALNGVVFPPNRNYSATFYMPSTNRSTTHIGRSSASGTVFGFGGRPTILNLEVVGGLDSDRDGIPDVGEQAIGTDGTRPDTDGDGITDSAEIEQGLDPLDNRGFPTGIIASLPLRGEAKEVTVEGSTLTSGGQTTYVATGSYGLAIVDASQFNNPIVLGQLDLVGDATDVAVDSSLRIVAVAANAGGLHLIDIADPMAPTLLRTITGSARQVEVVQGVAYVTVGTALRAYDLLTGDLLQSLSLPGGTLTGLAREGTFLYTMDSTRRLRAIDIGSFVMVARGSVVLPNGGGKLSVGNGIAYAAAADTSQGGFATANVGNPDSLVVLSGTDAPSSSAPGTAVVTNGSGLGLLIGQSGRVTGRPSSVQLVNVSDPTNTYNFLLQIGLPSPPSGIAVASGIAFIADGTSGLQVINYLPFDIQRQAPTVTASTTVPDVDPGTPGIQVLEGTSIPVRAAITDDVQVRNAELLVNGQVVRNDVSFPFDFFAIAPNIAPGAETFTIQVRATDTGGNATLSNVLTLGLVNDTFAPTIVSIEPPTNSSQIEPRETIKVRFSESMAAATLTAQTIRLRDSLGNFLTPATFQVRNDDRFVQLTFAPLTLGTYEIVLSAAALTDRAGNALGTANIVSPFSLTARASIGATVPDDDPGTPGLQVFEGTTLPLVVNVVPGVAVQRVEFLFNGLLIATDTTAPFTASAVAPLIAPGVNSFTLQARVTDTANLATLTNLLTVGLLEDVTAPTATATNPPAGGSTFRGATSLQVIFSESLAVGSLALAHFVLIGAGPSGLFDDGDDVPVAVTAAQALTDDTVVQLTVAPLPLGPHRLRVLAGGLADRAGNVLTTEFTSVFDVLDFIPLTINFNAGSGFPLSYTESGLTVISRWPSGHVHLGDQFFDGSPDLLNHAGCCSPPYEFFFAGGAPFTVVSLRVLQHSGTASFRVPGGPTLPVTGLGTINFPSTGWSNITSFFWDQPSGQTIIDDLMILARPGGAPLMGSRFAVSGSGVSPAAVGLPDARALADQAAAVWASALNLADVPVFTLTLADLPGGQLGATYQAGDARIVTLDPDANGVGWFVDPTPLEHSEFNLRPTPFAFQATANSPAASGYDLLTVLLHEIGHLVGFEGDHEHVDGHAHPFDLMNASLDPGVRKLPSDLDVRTLSHDHAVAQAESTPAFAPPGGILEALQQTMEPRLEGQPPPVGLRSSNEAQGGTAALPERAPLGPVLPSRTLASPEMRPERRVTDHVDWLFGLPEWLADPIQDPRQE